MSQLRVGFIPPSMGVVGLPALFFSFVEALARGRRISCRHPTGLFSAFTSRAFSSFEIEPWNGVSAHRSTIWYGDGPLQRPETIGAGLVLLGVTPSLEDVTRAKDVVRDLLSRGFSSEQISVVMWDAGVRGGWPAELVERFLELPVHAAVHYDSELTLRAENQTRLIQELAPRHKTVQALEALAVATCEKATRLERDAQDGPPAAPPEHVERVVAERLWKGRVGPSLAQESEPGHVDAMIARELKRACLEFSLGQVSSAHWERMRESVKDQLTGYGPLSALMKDPAITEIMVNGRGACFVERRGRVEPAVASFLDESHMRSVIDRMVGAAGRRVDLSTPVCDVRLSDGSRVNVVLPPVSVEGPLLTIRRFRASLLKLDDLINEGTLTKVQADQLEAAVRGRENIVIAGNSGSGKTTLLNILSRFIDETERIITLEDAAELRLQQPHVVRLETRPKNAEGEGEITMGQLVTNALRMRPDRLIIGECRGAETIPMLQAMNTGHDGSMTTLHANSAADALERLESMVLLGAPQWPVEVVRRQIASAIDLIIYLKRSGRTRSLEEIMKLGKGGS